VTLVYGYEQNKHMAIDLSLFALTPIINLHQFLIYAPDFYLMPFF